MSSAGSTGADGSVVGASVDVCLSAIELRDAEAALLGLLPAGHVLGEAVSDRTHSDAISPHPLVSVARSIAPSVLHLDLRDEEHTPIAGLQVVGADANLVTGRLVPARQRESGVRADLAMTAADLATVEGSPVLVVVDRPPLKTDDTRVRAVVQGREGAVWVVVADDPRSAVPAAVLLRTTRSWLASGGPVEDEARVHVRTVPLARRDPASDGRIRARLAERLGVPPDAFVHIGVDDPSSGAGVWRQVSRGLRDGRTTTVAAATPAVADVLLTWRPPRARRGVCVMFTGLSGSGKSTLARDLTEWLSDCTSRRVTLLDGDRVRRLLSAGLGFDRASREDNVRRIGFVAAEVVRHGGTAVCSPIAPFDATRQEVRAMVEESGDFVLVHVATPIDECERRDLKGLYARARAGELPDFTGISSPYEPPYDADLVIDTSRLNRRAARDALVALLREGGWIEEPP